MTRVLLTGGSGFLASHVLDILLAHKHSVVTTVRSQEKADGIKKAYPNASKGQLDFAIVPDIEPVGAFDEAMVSDPPFEAVIHTASPFHFDITDVKKDLLDPAINGTTGILKAVKAHAPTVKSIVITSSFAAILNVNLPSPASAHTYSEKDWNPITQDEALQNPSYGYRGSKTFAEKAAWDFVEKEKPNFTISTINPPLIFGPVAPSLASLAATNTSNQRMRAMAFGSVEKLPDTGTFVWVDVRDVALAHVKAMEIPEAAGKRFFVTAGYFSNKEIAQIIRENFPDLKKTIVSADAEGGDYPEGGTKSLYGYDNSRVKDVLGISFRSLKESVIDTVKSMQTVGA